ncbi:para-aminobenzoate synthetase component 1 [Gillisia mitskevichiae]|uniref:Anthranilate synthase component 1 n=1 Tax=Gillisia mitskevichiae TaxID=270921 RepID=A0A495PVI4_9FLAO|nr:anthranilate synthase component I family protein [Gillisia mitskevichiae]RKS53488.1 para-aminobenzoate synthetase component 1 [Gillisia mitskevichiae]
MRTTTEFLLEDPAAFKKKLFQWSSQFYEIAWLDSNNYPQTSSNYEAILAVEAFTALKTDHHGAFEQLKEYQETTKDWIFGYLSYDLKNDLENLSSKNIDELEFPDLYFFQPQKLILVGKEKVEFRYLKMVDDEINSDFDEILQQELDLKNIASEEIITAKPIQARISKEQYLSKVSEMLEHIHRGDIYEANFCQEYFAEERTINPAKVFKDLNEISCPPFATFLKLEDYYLLSASPERYITKKGNKVISQPIKGTARRADTEEEDIKIKEMLAKDPKEISENVMIVDLVRNDISRVAKRGSVQVDELCKVYSFKQVHQLVSTISADLEIGCTPIEVLKATFPMGSMTGAPKISAMKIIEELEVSKRGLYSGAVGYFTPDGDFDFNVVIRSILYNAGKQYVSFSVGGAITSRSIPEQEYEECQLKAKAMLEALRS